MNRNDVDSQNNTISPMNNKISVDAIISELNLRLGAKKIVHIGDSHTNIFQGINGVIQEHIGPVTAYNINNALSSSNTPKEIDIILEKLNKQDHALLLSFGEIDFRANAFKAALNKRISIQKVVESTADNYIKKINDLRSQSWNVLIHLPHASGSPTNPEWPAIGSEEERNTAILFFNSLIAAFCIKHTIPFGSLSEEAIEAQTLKTNYKVMNDGCHINVEPHNQSKLAERLLLNSAIGYGANVHPKNNDGEIEVAHGKPFLLSSRHYADPSNRYVSCRAPFFFHTENNNWEGIEIDLKAFYYLKRIVIQNRLDGFYERASFLRIGIIYHANRPSKNRYLDFDLTSSSFASDGIRPMVVNLPNALATKIQISTKDSCLHLSEIKVYALSPQYYSSNTSSGKS